MRLEINKRKIETSFTAFEFSPQTRGFQIEGSCQSTIFYTFRQTSYLLNSEKKEEDYFFKVVDEVMVCMR